MSLFQSKYTDKSLMANKDHVFLTWHDINFIVPKKKDQKHEDLLHIDDERISLIKKHGI